MVRSGAVRPAPNWSVAGLSVTDLAAAAVLSIGAAGLTSGLINTSHPHGALGASLGVLAMTAPVAVRRRFPLVAGGILAAGAVSNGLVFAPMVRCGAALPAVFLVVYAVGARSDRPAAATGLLLCTANVAGQAFWDPRLGPTVLGLMIPVLAAFFATGRLVPSRDQAAQVLRARSTELRRQRERTAQVAVLADRAKVAADLSATLHAEIGSIGTAAADGRTMAAGDPASTKQALATIERRGRDAPRQMHEVLGNLGDGAPSGPQPTFDQLPGLLTASTAATARLTVCGGAARTQTTKRMIYYYFGSKEQLFEAVLEQAYSEIRAAEQDVRLDHLDPLAAIRRLAEITFDHQGALPDFVSLVRIENIHQAEHIRRSAAIVSVNSPAIELITKILDQGEAEGFSAASRMPLACT